MYLPPLPIHPNASPTDNGVPEFLLYDVTATQVEQNSFEILYYIESFRVLIIVVAVCLAGYWEITVVSRLLRTIIHIYDILFIHFCKRPKK